MHFSIYLYFFFFIPHRCRSRSEQLECIGVQTRAMEINDRVHRSPLPPPPATAAHLANGNGSIDQWTKFAEQQNGHNQVTNRIYLFAFAKIHTISNLNGCFVVNTRYHWVQHRVAKKKAHRVIHDAIHHRKIHRVVLKVHRMHLVIWNVPTVPWMPTHSKWWLQRMVAVRRTYQPCHDRINWKYQVAHKRAQLIYNRNCHRLVCNIEAFHSLDQRQLN